MAKLSTDELLDAFKEMTLIELSEFIKQFEDVFDVKAAARSRIFTRSTSTGPIPVWRDQLRRQPGPKAHHLAQARAALASCIT
jgi:hypothetical protein